MADNYIEKKMEELRSGNGSAAVSFNNFDAIVARSAGACTVDDSYRIHPLQIAAITAAVSRIALEDVKVEVVGENVITFTSTNAINAGRAAQTAILKAVSMGLHAHMHDMKGSTAAIMIRKRI